ncbi:MAG: pilus assembly PilX N-terminal domain-containing protein [Curvibacter sp.]
MKRMQALQHTTQRGATLIVTLIFLMVMSLLSVTLFNITSTNTRITGNAQVRNEALAAAQVALASTISDTQFATNPALIAATPFTVDVDGDGRVDYSVKRDPRPRCNKVKTLKANELDPAIPADLACMGSAAASNSGIDSALTGSATGDSMCANSEWNIRASVSDPASHVEVAINQGVSLRVLVSDADSACK